MKLNKLYLLTTVSALAVMLCSCNREKPYNINGTLDLPEQIPFGDTVITVPSFEDTWVYLLNFDQTPIDSTQIHDNAFSFTGSIKPSDAYYVQLVSQIGSALLVIEPGDIDVYIDGNIKVTGTPANDCIADVDAAIDDLNNATYDHYAVISDSLRELGEEVTEEQQKAIYDDMKLAMAHIVDSIYEANKDNKGAVYATLMLLSDARSSEEFEQRLAKYPAEIREDALLKSTVDMMHYYEMMQNVDLSGEDPAVADSFSTVAVDVE